MSVEVTDHGLVRYMQRVMGIDVEAIRKDVADMLSARELPGSASGSMVVRLDGFRFVVLGGRLVTVKPHKWNDGAGGSPALRSELEPRV